MSLPLDPGGRPDATIAGRPGRDERSPLVLELSLAAIAVVVAVPISLVR
jgi:hypothetical protein